MEGGGVALKCTWGERKVAAPPLTPASAGGGGSWQLAARRARVVGSRVGKAHSPLQTALRRGTYGVGSASAAQESALLAAVPLAALPPFGASMLRAAAFKRRMSSSRVARSA